MKTLAKIILIASIFSISMNAYSIAPLKQIAKLIKSSKALSPKEIEKLAKLLGEVDGTKKVGKLLGKMKLPNEAIEDTFMRLAIYKNKIGRKDAKEMMQHLKDVPGFRETLRKVIGNSVNKTAGHLHELKLSKMASKNGFKVKAIGKSFNDGIKRSHTDIDIILAKKGKLFIIEAKDYLPNTNIMLDAFRSDMDTLISYIKKNPSDTIIPIFSMTKKPNSLVKLKQLEMIAKNKKVQLIFGTSYEQMVQIEQLRKIL